MYINYIIIHYLMMFHPLNDTFEEILFFSIPGHFLLISTFFNFY